MLSTVDKKEWQSALEGLRVGKADFMQRLATLNAGGLAVSISLLTGLQSKSGTKFFAKNILLSCWICLLISIALSLIYLCLHPTDDFNNKWLHVLNDAEEEAKRLKKYKPPSNLSMMDDEVFVSVVRDWTIKSVHRFRWPMLSLYALACLFSVLGYSLLVLFAGKNLFGY